jgi:calcineurin-like phosphoesterase family protein
MKRIFFIGDNHFGDDTIRMLETRPFKTVEEQTEKMVALWNEVVTNEDIVYIVGDFINPNADGYHFEKIKNLKGHKILIRGNHDTESDEFYYALGIEKIYDLTVIVDDFWIISHEPKYVNKNFPYANIFAHVHNNPIYKTYSERHYCVSAERINFRPILFSEIKKKILEENAKK